MENILWEKFCNACKENLILKEKRGRNMNKILNYPNKIHD